MANCVRNAAGSDNIVYRDNGGIKYYINCLDFASLKRVNNPLAACNHIVKPANDLTTLDAIVEYIGNNLNGNYQINNLGADPVEDNAAIAVCLKITEGDDDNEVHFFRPRYRQLAVATGGVSWNVQGIHAMNNAWGVSGTSDGQNGYIGYCTIVDGNVNQYVYTTGGGYAVQYPILGYCSITRIPD